MIRESMQGRILWRACGQLPPCTARRSSGIGHKYVRLGDTDICAEK
jgi:hypothetical protein